ncbi:MAG: phosphate ABC transporter permease subunit PstC [Jatrophihabitans sp.]
MTDRTTGLSADASSRVPLPPPRVAGESVLAPKPTDRPKWEHLAPGSGEPLGAGLDVPTPVVGAGLTAVGGKVRVGDRIFAAMSSGAAGFIIVLVVLIATFLVVKSLPSILADKDNILTSTNWQTTPGDLRFGLANLLWVTVIISIVAMVIAVPVAIGVALCITQYAPRGLSKPIAYVLDLLAAIPSIVYGIWGAFVLSPELEPVQRLLGHIPLPLFDNLQTRDTIFNGAVVLSVMILPIITAISRDVFERTPRANIEAALALGATKWEMIRIAVLPFGRAGVVSGAMLGLGRALGETIAVYLIVSTVSPPFRSSIFTGGETIASKIANGSAEFNNAASTGAYIAAGLALFILTFLVNSAARAIVNRKQV